MSIARLSSSLLAAGLLFVGAAHADTDTTTRRGATLTELRNGFADGERVGSLFSGPACQEQADRGWSELLAKRVQAELPRAFEQEMNQFKGAQPLQVQAFVNKLDMQLCQAPAAAWKGSIQVQVGWQVVSPVDGHVVYRASTEGAFTLAKAQRMSTSAAMRAAFAQSVRKLAAEPRFASLMQDARAINVASVH